jgi:hypothetical protein
MTLKIVWRNPRLSTVTRPTLQRIRGDESGAVYAVTARDLTQEFDVIQRQVA